MPAVALDENNVRKFLLKRQRAEAAAHRSSPSMRVPRRSHEHEGLCVFNFTTIYRREAPDGIIIIHVNFIKQ